MSKFRPQPNWNAVIGSRAKNVSSKHLPVQGFFSFLASYLLNSFTVDCNRRFSLFLRIVYVFLLKLSVSSDMNHRNHCGWRSRLLSSCPACSIYIFCFFLFHSINPIIFGHLHHHIASSLNRRAVSADVRKELLLILIVQPKTRKSRDVKESKKEKSCSNYFDAQNISCFITEIWNWMLVKGTCT